jgi:DNA ligase-1
MHTRLMLAPLLVVLTLGVSHLGTGFAQSQLGQPPVAGSAAAPQGGKPALMLANVYSPSTHLPDHWVSEKYDGVRGFWDGQRLLTRGGEVIHAPGWFTEGWPNVPMDGELWAGRGRFAHAVSTVRQQVPDDSAWKTMRFMVFDLPGHSGLFTERLIAYQQLVASMQKPWVVAVPQWRVATHAELQAQLGKTVKAGGEGLMLHRADAPYRGQRSDDLLKVKLHDDAEARVVAHVPGQGKHAGRLGALLVETPQGQRFRLGTGFTDAQRDQPPPVGETVTYRYRGLNESGVPRFASFVRVRAD